MAPERREAQCPAVHMATRQTTGRHTEQMVTSNGDESGDGSKRRRKKALEVGGEGCDEDGDDRHPWHKHEDRGMPASSSLGRR